MNKMKLTKFASWEFLKNLSYSLATFCAHHSFIFYNFETCHRICWWSLLCKENECIGGHVRPSACHQVSSPKPYNGFGTIYYLGTTTDAVRRIKFCLVSVQHASENTTWRAVQKIDISCTLDLLRTTFFI
jgi:hypothetical protein